MKAIFVPVLSLFLMSQAIAETAYISEELYVPVHRGNSNQYKIIKMLKAGNMVERLEDDPSTGYTHIVVPKEDLDGWVRTAQLSNEPAARVRIKTVEKELASLKKDYEIAKAELDASEKKRAKAENELAKLQGNFEASQKTITEMQEAKPEPAPIPEDTATLMSQVESLQKKVKSLEMEKQMLIEDKIIDWGLIGAGVLFAGLLIGLIAPNLRRRRSSWGSF